MAKVKPVKVGLIGSGAISYTYLTNLTNTFSIIDMVGCSDLIPERSKARSELFGIRQMTNEEILNDPEIEIVVNTTQITFHTEVTKMILDAVSYTHLDVYKRQPQQRQGRHVSPMPCPSHSTISSPYSGQKGVSPVAIRGRVG